MLDTQPSTLDTLSDEDNIRTIHSRVWRHSLYKNGFIVEISKIPNNFTDIQHLRVAHASYGAKSFYGVKFFWQTSATIYGVIS